MEVPVFVRVGSKPDALTISRLVKQQAEFHGMQHMLPDTEEGLAKLLGKELFRQDSGLRPVTLLLELRKEDPEAARAKTGTSTGTGTALATAAHQACSNNRSKTSLVGLQLDGAPAALTSITAAHMDEDEEEEKFQSAVHPERLVAGFLLFFPSFNTFQGMPGLFVESLYVRKPYRRCGVAAALSLAVGLQARERGIDCVEWAVAHWNIRAQKLFHSIGASLNLDWRLWTIAGDDMLRLAMARSPLRLSSRL